MLTELLNQYLKHSTIFEQFQLYCDYIYQSSIDFIDPFDVYDVDWKGYLFESQKSDIQNYVLKSNIKSLVISNLFVSLFSYLDGFVDYFYSTEFLNKGDENIKKFLTEKYDKLRDTEKRAFKSKNRRFSESRFRIQYLILSEYNGLSLPSENCKYLDNYVGKMRTIRNQMVHQNYKTASINLTEKEFRETSNCIKHICINILKVLIEVSH